MQLRCICGFGGEKNWNDKSPRVLRQTPNSTVNLLRISRMWMPKWTFDAWQMQSWRRPGSKPGSQHRQRIQEDPALPGCPKRSAEQVFAGYGGISYNGRRKHQNPGANLCADSQR